MIKAIKNMLPVAEAIEKLLHPHAEVVIHDMAKNKIAAIWNPFSKRRAHEPSLLTEEETKMQKDWIGPYKKINWDGKQLKSVSSLIRDEQGKAVAMLCINLNITDLERVNQYLTLLVSSEQFVPQPEILFKEDWQEKINQSVHTYLNEKQLNLETLTRIEKKRLIEHLQKIGAFSAKNAAFYIARILKVSRATVYNYLNTHSGK